MNRSFSILCTILPFFEFAGVLELLECEADYFDGGCAL
jgi:hypothetical protein